MAKKSNRVRGRETNLKGKPHKHVGKGHSFFKVRSPQSVRMLFVSISIIIPALIVYFRVGEPSSYRLGKPDVGFNFLHYTYEVIDHWFVLISGAILALVGFAERYTLRKASWTLYVCIMLLLMFYASFLTWQDENDRASSLSKELQKVRAQFDKSEIEEQTLEAARRSALAAEQGNIVAKFAHRAFLEQSDYKANRAENGYVIVSITLKNTGKSEALEIQSDISLWLDGRQLARTVRPDSVPLGQETTITFPVEATLLSDQWRDIDAGRSKLYAKLIVSYRDPLHQQRTTTGWCNEYIPGEQTIRVLCALN